MQKYTNANLNNDKASAGIHSKDIEKVDRLSALLPELLNHVVGFFKKPKPILALA